MDSPATENCQVEVELYTPSDISYTCNSKTLFPENTPEEDCGKTETLQNLSRPDKIDGAGKNKSWKEKGHKLSKRKLFLGHNVLTNSNQESESFHCSVEKRKRSDGNVKNNPVVVKKLATSCVVNRPLTERQQLAFLLEATSNQTSSECNDEADSAKEPFTKIKSRKGRIKTRVYRRNERGETPLHIAAIKGDVLTIKKLIKDGANVRIKDYAGWTALHEACNHGNLSATKILLERGAVVNEPGFEGDTPLHDAVINNHVQIVDLLLSFGANPVQSNTKNKTPLELIHSKEMQEVFISRGIDCPQSCLEEPEIKEANHETNGEEKSGKGSELMKGKKNPHQFARDTGNENDLTSVKKIVDQDLKELIIENKKLGKGDLNTSVIEMRQQNVSSPLENADEHQKKGSIVQGDILKESTGNQSPEGGYTSEENIRLQNMVSVFQKKENKDETLRNRPVGNTRQPDGVMSMRKSKLEGKASIVKAKARKEEDVQCLSRNQDVSTLVRKIEYQNKGSIMKEKIQRKQTQGESKMEKPVMYICKLAPSDKNEEMTVRTTTISQDGDSGEDVTESGTSSRPTQLSCSTGNFIENQQMVIKEKGDQFPLVKVKLCAEVQDGCPHKIKEDVGNSDEKICLQRIDESEGSVLRNVSVHDGHTASLLPDEESTIERKKSTKVLLGQHVPDIPNIVPDLPNSKESVVYNSTTVRSEDDFSDTEGKGKEDTMNEAVELSEVNETLGVESCLKKGVSYSVQCMPQSESESRSSLTKVGFKKTIEPLIHVIGSKVTEQRANITDRQQFHDNNIQVDIDDKKCNQVVNLVRLNEYEPQQTNHTSSPGDDKSKANEGSDLETHQVEEQVVYVSSVVRKPSTTWRSLMNINKCNVSEIRIPFYDQFLINTKKYELGTEKASIEQTTRSTNAMLDEDRENIVSKEKESKIELTRKQKSEQDKLQISMEHEIVRFYTRDAYKSLKFGTPPGVCDALYWQKMTSQQLKIEKQKFNQRRFSGSSKDLRTNVEKIIDKYDKLKNLMAIRHKHEQHALDAVNKRETQI